MAAQNLVSMSLDDIIKRKNISKPVQTPRSHVAVVPVSTSPHSVAGKSSPQVAKHAKARSPLNGASDLRQLISQSSKTRAASTIVLQTQATSSKPLQTAASKKLADANPGRFIRTSALPAVDPPVQPPNQLSLKTKHETVPVAVSLPSTISTQKKAPEQLTTRATRERLGRQNREQEEREAFFLQQEKELRQQQEREREKLLQQHQLAREKELPLPQAALETAAERLPSPPLKRPAPVQQDVQPPKRLALAPTFSVASTVTTVAKPKPLQDADVDLTITVFNPNALQKTRTNSIPPTTRLTPFSEDTSFEIKDPRVVDQTQNLNTKKTLGVNSLQHTLENRHYVNTSEGRLIIDDSNLVAFSGKGGVNNQDNTSNQASLPHFANPLSSVAHVSSLSDFDKEGLIVSIKRPLSFSSSSSSASPTVQPTVANPSTLSADTLSTFKFQMSSGVATPQAALPTPSPPLTLQSRLGNRLQSAASNQTSESPAGVNVTNGNARQGLISISRRTNLL